MKQTINNIQKNVPDIQTCKPEKHDKLSTDDEVKVHNIEKSIIEYVNNKCDDNANIIKPEVYSLPLSH